MHLLRSFRNFQLSIFIQVSHASYLGKLQHTNPKAPPGQWGPSLLPGQPWCDASEDPTDPARQAQRDAVHQPQVPGCQGPQGVQH